MRAGTQISLSTLIQLHSHSCCLLLCCKYTALTHTCWLLLLVELPPSAGGSGAARRARKGMKNTLVRNIMPVNHAHLLPTCTRRREGGVGASVSMCVCVCVCELWCLPIKSHLGALLLGENDGQEQHTPCGYEVEERLADWILREVRDERQIQRIEPHIHKPKV